MSDFSKKLLFISLSIVGLLLIPTLPYKLITEHSLPTLKVSYKWTGANELSLEEQVTSKLEAAFASEPQISRIFSRSYADHGEIYLEFDKNTNINKKKIDLSSLVKQVYHGMPSGLTYPIISNDRPENDDVQLLNYSVWSSADNRQLVTFIKKTLEPKLAQITNVKSVKFYNLPQERYEIKYDAARITKLSLSSQNLAKHIKEVLKTVSLGKLNIDGENGTERFSVTLRGSDLESELNDLPIKATGTKIIKLQDIATVHKDQASEVSLQRINGHNAVGLSIIAEADGNQIAIANEVKGVIAQMQNKFPSYNILVTYDATSQLKIELMNFGLQSAISFLLLGLTVAVFYQNIKSLAIVFCSLLASILLGICAFKLFAIPMHIYSLMALPISLGFIICNSIIAIDHYMKSNRGSIAPQIIAASLTSIVPLSVIFFLNDSEKIKLIDFAWSFGAAVISSLIVALWLIPAIGKPISNREQSKSRSNLRKICSWNTIYLGAIKKLRKWKAAITILLIILFGFPFSALPDRIENNSSFREIYNSILGTSVYLQKIKPLLENYLGGAINRFVTNSNYRPFISTPERLKITLRIKAPFGSDQYYLDEICKTFEHKLQLNKDAGIDFFQTKLYDSRNAQIDIFFLPNCHDSFPIQLKTFLEMESVGMSGIQFSIFGVDNPFGTGDYDLVDGNLLLYGYDYQKLHDYASILKTHLEGISRVDEVKITSEPSWFASVDRKFRIAEVYSMPTSQVMKNLYERFTYKRIGSYSVNGTSYELRLFPSGITANSLYDLNEKQYEIDDSTKYKLGRNIRIELSVQPTNIVKQNQEYQIAIQYQFKGTQKHNDLFRKETVRTFQNLLPSGFSIREDASGQRTDNHVRLYFSLLLSIFGIFSVCSILFESFKKALALILIIPLTLIGVLYILNYLDLGFNLGIFAALILLAGLLVNSSIFILTEYFSIVHHSKSARAYCKAINRKFAPIFVTSASVVSGLVPFLLFDSVDQFWFPLAIVMCSGLLVSMLVIAFILPIYLIKDNVTN